MARKHANLANMSARYPASILKPFAFLMMVACLVLSGALPAGHVLGPVEHSHELAEQHVHHHHGAHCHGHAAVTPPGKPAESAPAPCDQDDAPCDHRHSHTLRCCTTMLWAPAESATPTILATPEARLAWRRHAVALRDGPPRAIEQPPKLSA